MKAFLRSFALLVVSASTHTAFAQNLEFAPPVPSNRPNLAESLRNLLKTKPGILDALARDAAESKAPREIDLLVDELVREIKKSKQGGRFECGYTVCDNN